MRMILYSVVIQMRTLSQPAKLGMLWTLLTTTIALDAISDTPNKMENASLSLHLTALHKLQTFWAQIVAQTLHAQQDTLILLKVEVVFFALSVTLVRITWTLMESAINQQKTCVQHQIKNSMESSVFLLCPAAWLGTISIQTHQQFAVTVTSDTQEIL